MSLLALVLFLFAQETRLGPLGSEAVLHPSSRRGQPSSTLDTHPVRRPFLSRGLPSFSLASPGHAFPFAALISSSSFTSRLSPSSPSLSTPALSSPSAAPSTPQPSGLLKSREIWRGRRSPARLSPLGFTFSPSTSLFPVSPSSSLSPASPSSTGTLASSACSACSLSSPSLRGVSLSPAFDSSLRPSSRSALFSESPSPSCAPSGPHEADEQQDISLLLSKPRGFCAGVSRAIGIVEEALRIWGPPVYVKHSIVHNEVVCDAMRKKGAIFVEEISDIPHGAVAVFSAHGVSPAVRAEAEARQLQVVDATCPLVTKVHVYVKQKAEQGYHIILIGHKDHVEVMGTKGEAPDAVTVVETVEDVEKLAFPASQKLFYATQTTLSLDDCGAIRQALINKYPKIESIPSGSICYATTNRQTALQRLAPETDLTIVVGSQASSNAKRLVETAQRRGTTAYLVNDPSAIDPRWLENVTRISLTSSASTPEATTAAVVRRLQELGVARVSEHEGILEKVPQWKFPKNLQEAGRKKVQEESRHSARGQEGPIARDA